MGLWERVKFNIVCALVVTLQLKEPTREGQVHYPSYLADVFATYTEAVFVASMVVGVRVQPLGRLSGFGGNRAGLVDMYWFRVFGKKF